MKQNTKCATSLTKWSSRHPVVSSWHKISYLPVIGMCRLIDYCSTHSGSNCPLLPPLIDNTLPQLIALPKSLQRTFSSNYTSEHTYVWNETIIFVCIFLITLLICKELFELWYCSSYRHVWLETCVFRFCVNVKGIIYVTRVLIVSLWHNNMYLP